MLSIIPCRNSISDRFPIASFVVHVPPSRVFEIACATDPALLRPERQPQRTPENFYTSRSGGLLRAPAGQATYLLPPEQLQRFAGRQRLYYALASYADLRGEAPEFSVLPAVAEQAPWIRLAPDFTGRTLDRSRLRKPASLEARYGARAPMLTWGGDRLGAEPLPPPQAYDDGYSPDLWRARAEPADPADPRDPSVQEPPGYEDAPALRAQEEIEAYGRRSGGSAPPPQPSKPPVMEHPAVAPALEEPPGVEEPQQLSGARYGAAEPVAVPAAASVPAATAVPPGVDDAYEDQFGLDPEGELRAKTPSLDSVTLTIPEKFRLLQPAAASESGSAGYAAVNPDDEFSDPTHAAFRTRHYGLHWGFLQFNQRSGALGRVLLACERRSPVLFRETFGPQREQLLQTATAADEEARLRPVGGAHLWQEPWLTRFRNAGRAPQFQAAQNEVAIEGYVDPNLPFAAALGFQTERALAMLIDRCVDMGNAAGRRFVVEAVTPLKDEAAVTHALSALGHASVRDFQRASGLPETGKLGPKGHAALLGALRVLGEKSPIKLPALPEMLDALVHAANGRRFEARVAALRGAAELSDAPRQVN